MMPTYVIGRCGHVKRADSFCYCVPPDVVEAWFASQRAIVTRRRHQ